MRPTQARKGHSMDKFIQSLLCAKMWFFVVLFTRFAYSVSPGQVDREPDSGHIWMQFPFKLMLKHLP